MADARNPHAVKVLSIAKKFVDDAYVETGNNITIMGKWYGAQGQPWCAMFVSYCFDQANLVNLVAAQSKKGFAGCAIGLQYFTKHGQLVPVGQAQPGDIVFFQFDTDADPDHVGLVYQNNGKTLVTFEGNTSGDTKGSQSNGGGAYRKNHSYSDVMAIARPKWPV